MNIKEIKVPNFIYKVKENSLSNYDDELYGVTKREKLLITINKSLDEDMKRLTLIHELLHALELNSGIKYCEESQIEQFAHGLYYVLNNNPELVKYLIE